MIRYQNIYLVGKGYLSNKLIKYLKDFSQKRKINFNSYPNLEYFILNKKIENSIVILSCFPSVKYDNFYETNFLIKKIFVDDFLNQNKNSSNKIIFFNTLRIQYKIIQNDFDKKYISYNEWFLKQSFKYNNFYNLLLPFIYDKDLYKKENSIAHKIYKNNLSIKDFGNKLIPFMKFRNFKKFIHRIITDFLNNNKIDNILVPSYSLITEKQLYLRIYNDLKNRN